MHFSTGDLIALIGVVLVAVKWFWGILDTRTKEESEEAGKLTQLTSDFLVHKREDELQFKWIREALERIERRVENLQSQMRFVAKERLEDKE